MALKIVVEGSRGEVVDSVSRELTLPDFTRVQVSLATPRVYRGRTVVKGVSLATTAIFILLVFFIVRGIV